MAFFATRTHGRFRLPTGKFFVASEDFYTEIVALDLREKYLSEKFESISKEFLIRANRAERFLRLYMRSGFIRLTIQKRKSIANLMWEHRISWAILFTNVNILINRRKNLL